MNSILVRAYAKLRDVRNYSSLWSSSIVYTRTE